jgi:hypothetical protein
MKIHVSIFLNRCAIRLNRIAMVLNRLARMCNSQAKLFRGRSEVMHHTCVACGERYLSEQGRIDCEKSHQKLRLPDDALSRARKRIKAIEAERDAFQSAMQISISLAYRASRDLYRGDPRNPDYDREADITAQIDKMCRDYPMPIGSPASSGEVGK